MKKLQVDWLELATAFERQAEERWGLNEELYYFDKESGQIIVVDEIVRDAMDSVLENLNPAVLNETKWTVQDICQMPSYEALPDCVKSNVMSAIQLEFGTDTSCFESIPQFSPHDVFQWMTAFVETVRDDETRERLVLVLRQHKTFRQFRDAMGSDRRLQRDWRSFELAQQRKRMIEWLHSIDVEPLNLNDSIGTLPPLPDLRQIMFTEVRQFVRFARELPGVQRIALIGSLASDKEFPKDIDMLVTITDDCDLTDLAKLSRQLVGYMVGHASGADVFLASPTGKYLGRTCPWKRCGRGSRMSCDAQSCGVRHYLHDDFNSIRLSEELIQHPPVLLWPKPHATSTDPLDIHEHLIEPLALDLSR